MLYLQSGSLFLCDKYWTRSRVAVLATTGTTISTQGETLHALTWKPTGGTGPVPSLMSLYWRPDGKLTILT